MYDVDDIVAVTVIFDGAPPQQCVIAGGGWWCLPTPVVVEYGERFVVVVRDIPAPGTDGPDG